jgi:hypothetical protein
MIDKNTRINYLLASSIDNTKNENYNMESMETRKNLQTNRCVLS